MHNMMLPETRFHSLKFHSLRLLTDDHGSSLGQLGPGRSSFHKVGRFGVTQALNSGCNDCCVDIAMDMEMDITVATGANGRFAALWACSLCLNGVFVEPGWPELLVTVSLTGVVLCAN